SVTSSTTGSTNSARRGSSASSVTEATAASPTASEYREGCTCAHSGASPNEATSAGRVTSRLYGTTSTSTSAARQIHAVANRGLGPPRASQSASPTKSTGASAIR